jgi:hypothetical protein
MNKEELTKTIKQQLEELSYIGVDHTPFKLKDIIMEIIDKIEAYISFNPKDLIFKQIKSDLITTLDREIKYAELDYNKFNRNRSTKRDRVNYFNSLKKAKTQIRMELDELINN